MAKDKIWLSSPHLGGDEMTYIEHAFEKNWIAPLGANVDGFEKDLQEYNAIEHCAVLNSGTSALHIALILLGVNQDDLILCSSFTFSATANAIRYQKAIPVFIDSEIETWNMSPDLLEKAIVSSISKGKKPKACILVHLYGMPAKISEIMKICSEYEIPVIEDAAESLGSTYKGQKTGTFGELGVYSFNGNKIITTSGGGALVSRKKEHIEKARFLSTQARDPAPHYQHSEIGYNYRMSNICAGIGRGQMKVLDSWVNKRRAINHWYSEILRLYPYISVLKEPSDEFRSNHWLTTIIVEDNPKGRTRESLRLGLLEWNIESRPLWKPMHLQPVFQSFPAYLDGTSEYLFEKGLCLPSGSNMTEEQKSRIKESILSLLEK